jgi:hypothetical protein
MVKKGLEERSFGVLTQKWNVQQTNQAKKHFAAFGQFTISFFAMF